MSVSQINYRISNDDSGFQSRLNIDCNSVFRPLRLPLRLSRI